MHKMLIPLTLAAVLCTGYSVNWLKAGQRGKASARLSAYDIYTSEAALRHKHCQPAHWRALVLQQ